MKEKTINKYFQNIYKQNAKKYSIIFFVIGLLIVSILAIIFYNGQKRNLRKEVEGQLKTVTDYKALTITEWLDNKFFDYIPLYTNTAFTKFLEEVVLHKNYSTRKELQKIFDHERKTNDLEAITFYNTKGEVIIRSSIKTFYSEGITKSNLDSVLFKGKNFLTTFIRSKADPTIHISFYIPIIKKDEGREKTLGVIALNANPSTSLNPYINYWTEDHQTVESLIFKVNIDSIIFINDVRFNKDLSSLTKLPFDREELPIVKAVKGFEGIVEGIDYRGSEVLACIKKINKPDWFLVTKIDKDEIFFPLLEKGAYLFLLVFILLLTIYIGINTRTKSLQADLYQKLYKAEADRNIIKTNFEQYFIYAGDVILLLDNNFRIVEANQKASVELQYSHKELFGLDSNTITTEIFSTKYKDILESTDDNCTFIETKIKRKDGTEFFAEAGLRKIEVENRIFYQAIIRNITDRISSTNQIIKLNNALQIISSCSRSLVKAKSETQLIQNICNIIIEKGGYSFTWMGYAIKDEEKHILPHYHTGNGNEFINKYNITWSDKANGNTPEGIAIRTGKTYISSDNETSEFTSEWKNEAAKSKLASTIALPLISHDEVIGVLSISSNEKSRFDSAEEVDILEELSNDLSYGILSIREREKKKNAEKLLIESEEKYRSFFEDDLTGDFTFSVNGKILICNKAFTKILGINSFVEAKKYNLYDFYLKKEELDDVIKTIKDKGKVENHKTTLVGVTGKTICVVENMKGRYDDNGNLIEITGYLFDITEITKAEEQLIISKEKAEAANQLKSEFLAQMSHEIRTPLNAILSFSELIEDDLASKVGNELKEGFSGLKRAGKRITRTIDSILNLSELHTGAYDFSPRIIDIHTEIIEDLYLEFFMLLKEKKLNFSVNANTNNTKVYADEYSTKQIFANLIDNAIKFTPSGGIKIIMERDVNGRLCVTVNDTGIGIAKEYIPKLFTPFSQEEQGYTRSFDGNGLGLALVKRYCEVNNIQINVQSRKGNGTTFTLNFLT